MTGSAANRRANIEAPVLVRTSTFGSASGASRVRVEISPLRRKSPSALARDGPGLLDVERLADESALLSGAEAASAVASALRDAGRASSARAAAAWWQACEAAARPR